jgi:hypothetical protein
MFEELEGDVQDILGWSSHIGQQFVAEVIEAFAESQGKQISGEHLKDCIDPLAILGEPNPYIREFRDRAFHVAANTYFRDDLSEDEYGLSKATWLT